MKLIVFLRSLFIGKEKDFIEKFYEVLNEKRYVNLAKIKTKLPVTQRIDVVNKLLSENLIFGVFLSSKKYFFSLDRKLLEEIEQKFKQTGKINIELLRKQWSISEKLLKLVLQKLGKGFLSHSYYYSYNYVYSFIKNNLERCEEELSLKNLADELDLDEKIILNLTKNLISENEVKGVINGSSIFLSEERSIQLIMQIVEEQSQKSPELTFEDISTETDVPISFIEPILLKIVQENPDRFILYPLDKKLMIKN